MMRILIIDRNKIYKIKIMELLTRTQVQWRTYQEISKNSE